MSWGCVVLTAGRAPEDLRRALESLLAQRGVETDVVVVGNGCEPEGLPDGVRLHVLAENQGIPGGRNAGAGRARGDLLLFLDDDASLAASDALERVEARFAQDPQLGMLQLGVAPLDGGAPLRNWVPRLRVGDRTRPSDVTAVWEGAVAIRHEVFDAVGGWPADFRFIHEGVDLAWRVMDAGHRIHYAGDITVLHPTHAPLRHDYSHYHSARNRVWLARRHLPLPLGALFVATFLLRTLPHLRTPAALRSALRGYRDGLRDPCGPRRPLRAATLWRMTRAGRPPVI